MKDNVADLRVLCRIGKNMGISSTAYLPCENGEHFKQNDTLISNEVFPEQWLQQYLD
jgi:hypothetical protein